MSDTSSVFVLGDSISMHYGPELERALLGRVAYARKTGEEEALRDLDVPLGANGGDSGRVRAYLFARFAAEPEFRPSVLLLNCGLHDVKRERGGAGCQVGLDAYRANLLAIAQACEERGQRFVWVRTTPVDEAKHDRSGRSFTRSNADIDAYNAAADAIVRASSDCIGSVDLHGFSLPLLAEGSDDGVHFLPAVRALQAAFIAGHLLAWQQACY